MCALRITCAVLSSIMGARSVTVRGWIRGAGLKRRAAQEGLGQEPVSEPGGGGTEASVGDLLAAAERLLAGGSQAHKLEKRALLGGQVFPPLMVWVHRGPGPGIGEEGRTPRPGTD